MNQLDRNRPLQNPDPGCADLTVMAERELSSFFNAVKELFGAEQAELSAKDWLRELDAMDSLPASTPEWRSITVKVSTRLASRMNPPQWLAPPSPSTARRPSE